MDKNNNNNNNKFQVLYLNIIISTEWFDGKHFGEKQKDLWYKS